MRDHCASHVSIGRGLSRVGQAVAVLRRPDIGRPTSVSGAVLAAQEDRRPVGFELRRMLGAAGLVVLGVIILDAAAIWLLHSAAHPSSDLVSVRELVTWAREQRSLWSTDTLLGIPAAVLVPALFTVLFAPPPQTAGDLHRQPPRRQAQIEVLAGFLSIGLLVSACLAGLALVPRVDGLRLPDMALAAFLLGGCAVFSQILWVDGTRQALDHALAMYRRDRSATALRDLRIALSAQAAPLTALIAGNRWARIAAFLLAPIATGAVGAAVFWTVVLLGGAGADDGLEAALVTAMVWAYAGFVGTCVVQALSRRRCSLSTVETVEAAGLLGLMAVSQIPALAYLAAAILDGRDPTVWWVFLLVAASGCVGALLVDRSVLASVVDYRRVAVVGREADLRIGYLAGTGNRDREGHVGSGAT